MEPPIYTDGRDSARFRSQSRGNVEDNEPKFPDMQAQLGHMMWEAGTKQVQDTFMSYGKIDLFRPYFDIEPKEVQMKLIRSFIPRKPSQMASTPDLYGPTMIVLTMIALLLFNMKSSGYIVPNGTLMGTSFFTCFGSWIILSGAIYILCFLLGADVPMLSVVSVFGYSLFSQCVVLLLTSVFHSSHDHLLFFGLVMLFCVPSAIRMSLLVSKNARIPTHRLILAGSAFALHFLLIVYLHFGFHVMVEELDSIIDGNIMEEVKPKAV